MLPLGHYPLVVNWYFERQIGVPTIAKIYIKNESLVRSGTALRKRKQQHAFGGSPQIFHRGELLAVRRSTREEEGGPSEVSGIQGRADMVICA